MVKQPTEPSSKVYKKPNLPGKMDKKPKPPGKMEKKPMVPIKVAKKPKLPSKMDNVFKQCEAHPKLASLPTSVAVGYMVARSASPMVTRPCVMRENNKYARAIWRHLYLGEDLLC